MRASSGAAARRELSAREVMAAHLAQIERLNPQLNAIVAQARRRRVPGARRRGRSRGSRSGEPLGPLHGLPIAFKDLQPAVGFPFTRGSPIFKDVMPTEDSRARRAAARAPARSRSARPTCRSSAWARTPTTRCTARRVNPYDLDQERGRLERRRGRGARGRHAADRRRQRPRRLAAQSRPTSTTSSRLRPTVGLVPIGADRRCRSSASR